MGNKLYTSKNQGWYSFFYLIFAFLVLLKRQSFMDFKYVEKDIILKDRRLQNLPGMSDEVLVVANKVGIVSFYAEAKKSKQLLY